MSSIKEIVFPSGFLWGTATAAHQIEGNNFNNNWWRFEQEPNRILNKDSSKGGCDHWNRYEEDFNFITQMSNNAYRLSIEWSKIIPERGIIDNESVEHYHKILDTIIRLKVVPFITLLHFTYPLWWESHGALLNQKSSHIHDFTEFVQFIVREFGEKITYWNTINEPNIIAILGYFLGLHPPGQMSMRKAFRAGKTLMLMHGKAYKSIKQIRPNSQVGLVKNMAAVRPFNPKSLLDRLTSKFVDYTYNGATLRALKKGKINFGIFRSNSELKNSSDFIGLNFYNFLLVSHRIKDLALTARPETDQSFLCEGLGWEPYPDGILQNLQRLHKLFPDKPIYITENGIGTGNDEWRQRYMVHHLKKVSEAIDQGIPIRGYFHWSLLDNFEWAEGYKSRFGLVEVDFSTKKRSLKESGKLYGLIAKQNKISSEILKKYNDWPLKGL